MQDELCVLLRLNPRVQEEYLISQLSWIPARLLITCVCIVYLVDELILMFCTPPSHDGASGGSFDIFQHMVSLV